MNIIQYNAVYGNATLPLTGFEYERIKVSYKSYCLAVFQDFLRFPRVFLDFLDTPRFCKVYHFMSAKEVIWVMCAQNSNAY